MKVSKWILSLFMVASLVISAGADKPNVIVFLVDDMGVMDTSVPFLTDEGGQPKRYPLNDWYRTPNLERLAKQGIRFSNFYAQSVCSPTRASIMTGQNATRHGTTTWINPFSNNRGKNGPREWNWEGLKKGDVTLPGLLQANGYRTIHVGKAHFAPRGREGADPIGLGFDVNIGGDCWGHPKSYYGAACYGNPPQFKEGGSHAIPSLEKYHGTDTFLTEALTLEANVQIGKAAKEKKPFYLYMAHYAVHKPFQADSRFAKHYEDSDKGKDAQAYATLVEGVDKSLGDILGQLGKLGVAENTLVIFLGDNGSDAPLGAVHGYSSSAPLRGKKGTSFEGGMRVPFIAAWAKADPKNPWQKKLTISQGAIQGQLGTVMDIYPTILNLIGIEDAPGHVVDGYNLATQFSGNINPDRSEAFLMHFPHNHQSSYYTSYRSKGWKLIYDYNPAGKKPTNHQLYNLKEDPFEKNNLAAENPEMLQQMVNAMARQLEAENALYPIDKDGNELKPRL